MFNSDCKEDQVCLGQGKCFPTFVSDTAIPNGNVVPAAGAVLGSEGRLTCNSHFHLFENSANRVSSQLTELDTNPVDWKSLDASPLPLCQFGCQFQDECPLGEECAEGECIVSKCPDAISSDVYHAVRVSLHFHIFKIFKFFYAKLQKLILKDESLSHLSEAYVKCDYGYKIPNLNTPGVDVICNTFAREAKWQVPHSEEELPRCVQKCNKDGDCSNNGTCHLADKTCLAKTCDPRSPKDNSQLEILGNFTELGCKATFECDENYILDPDALGGIGQRNVTVVCSRNALSIEAPDWSLLNGEKIPDCIPGTS